jgi:hypothetical protein
MSHSRKPASYQVTIDDFLIASEYIPGFLPADDSRAETYRAQKYRELIGSTATEIACIPDQKLHVFPVGTEKCFCRLEKEAK